MSTNLVVPAAPPPTRAPRVAGDGRGARTAGRSWLGAALLAVAGCVAALSLLGPLMTGVIDYRITDLVLNQLIGLDAVSLALVAPLAALAGVLTLRGHALGPVLALGPAAYVAYMVPQYVLGPDYLNLAGNNERFFGLLLALFVLGVCGAITAWAAIDLSGLPASKARERVVGRVLLPIAAVLVFGRYALALADWMSATPTAKDYLAGPTFGWTIALLDLGLALPASVAVCIGVRRGARWAQKGLYAIVAWYALVGTAVAAMAISMYVRDDSTMSAAQMAIMSVLGAALVALFLLVELAARGLRGIAWDLPGLGLAERPRDFDYSWTGFGRFCREAVDALGLERVHLVVHDIGGPVGFELATAVPDRVASLTVLNTVIEVDTFRRPWSMEPFACRGLGEVTAEASWPGAA